LSVLQRTLVFGRMIRFSHSVFAMPFALASFALAARGAEVPWSHLAWIVAAMVGARSAAMGFNRLADQHIDARNPRTASRELPRGALSRAEVWAFVFASLALFGFAAWRLNPLCLALAPVAMAVILGYSYTKRFTSLSHLVLGLALAIAPVGAWIAVRGRFDPAPVALAVAVLAWVAGFDIIYACQDVAFDRAEGLHSLPARLGVAGALRVSRALHVVAVAALAAVYPLARVHPVYLAGVVLVALLLAYEHSLVHADDLRRVDAAFFAVNGWVGMGYLAVTLLAVALPGPAPTL
jgi:4-hydroxybenzoate polyprenyltransferase